MSGIPTDLDFINLDDIDDGNTIPDGEYVVKLMEPTIRETQAKDGHYLSYYVIVQDGPYNGRRVYSFWSFKPQALWRMKKDFKAMNYTPADGRPKLADLEGFEGVVHVKTEPDKREGHAGESRQNLSWIAPLL